MIPRRYFARSLSSPGGSQMDEMKYYALPSSPKHTTLTDCTTTALISIFATQLNWQLEPRQCQCQYSGIQILEEREIEISLIEI